MPASTKTGVTPLSATTRVHEIYIRASAQAIWDAITSPEWNEKYGYRAPQDYELRPGGAYRAHASVRVERVCPDATPITSWLHSAVKSNECRLDAMFAAIFTGFDTPSSPQRHSYSFL